jgi:hypothetical protein
LDRSATGKNMYIFTNAIEKNAQASLPASGEDLEVDNAKTKCVFLIHQPNEGQSEHEDRLKVCFMFK